MESEEESPALPSNSTQNQPPPLPARPKQTSVPPVPFQDESIFEPDADIDDEISQQMTASYSEISVKSGLSPENETTFGFSLDHIPLEAHIRERPMTLPGSHSESAGQPFGPLNLEGTVHVEGNMTYFVAEDLEYKIKLSSPVAKKGDTLPGGSRSSTPNILQRQLLTPQLGQLDTGLLNDLEFEARKVATSIDNLTENLCGILHSISSITADNVDVYKNAVSKMSDAMDGNIKSMYTIMAKTEEVAQAMKSVQAHSTRIREIKRLVDFFESHI